MCRLAATQAGWPNQRDNGAAGPAQQPRHARLQRAATLSSAACGQTAASGKPCNLEAPQAGLTQQRNISSVDPAQCYRLALRLRVAALSGAARRACRALHCGSLPLRTGHHTVRLRRGSQTGRRSMLQLPASALRSPPGCAGALLGRHATCCTGPRRPLKSAQAHAQKLHVLYNLPRLHE